MDAKTFNEREIAAWKKYEKVRKGGKYNMFDPRARAATTLSHEMYSFVMKHYGELKEFAATRSQS